jgi:hypothetical protein
VKKFQISVIAIDGKLLENPQLFWFKCFHPKPVGVQVVRNYNQNECIVAKSVFLFQDEGHVFGTTDVWSVGEFIEYMKARCIRRVTFDCCYVTFDEHQILLDCE